MKFEEATVKVKELSKRPNDETLLKLYGLYKQAMIGDCNTSQPWAVQFEERAKWDAWDSHRGKTQETAKKEYVKLVEKLLIEDINRLTKELSKN